MHQLNTKEIILGILTVAAGLLNAYLWKGLLFAGEFRDAAFYSLPVIALFCFAILFALSSAFITRPVLRTVSAMIALAGGYLLVPASTVAASAAGASAMAGWYASDVIASEYRTANAFAVRKIFRGGLPVFFTAVALLLAVFYFSLASGQDKGAFLPRSLFDAVVPLAQGPLRGILPGFRPEASVDEFLLALAARQAGLDAGQLRPREQERLVRESRETLSKEFGITLTGRERTADVLYRVVSAQIIKFVGPYQRYLPFLAAFGFFVAVKAFTLPVYWVSLILLFAVVKLLLKMGVLQEKAETIQIVRVTL